jgi:hypothetical protein
MKLFLFVFLLLPFYSFGQFGGAKLDSYKASNGKTYNAGDTIKMGRGSDPDGYFRYLAVGGYAKFLQSGYADAATDKKLSGNLAVIKKIHQKKVNGSNKIIFAVRFDKNDSNYDLYIEDAIGTCEVADCKQPGTPPAVDKFDQLKKLKSLLDNGTLTQAEFDAQKKKILDQP